VVVVKRRWKGQRCLRRWSVEETTGVVCCGLWVKKVWNEEEGVVRGGFVCLSRAGGKKEAANWGDSWA
jgi:hypothetical protein